MRGNKFGPAVHRQYGGKSVDREGSRERAGSEQGAGTKQIAPGLIKPGHGTMQEAEMKFEGHQVSQLLLLSCSLSQSNLKRATVA